MKRHVYKKTYGLWSFLSLLIALSVPYNLRAQMVDSLILKYTDKSGKVNIDSLIRSSKTAIFSDPDQAFNAAKQAVYFSKKQRDPLRLGNSYRLLGAYYNDARHHFDSAYYYYGLADSIYTALNTKEAVDESSILRLNYGAIKQKQGDYLGAVEEYTEALRLFDQTGNEVSRSKTLNNLAGILYGEDNKRAEMYARECVKIARKNKDEFMIATGILSLVSVLVDYARTDQADPEEIVTLLNEMQQIAEKNNYKHHQLLYYYNYGVLHTYQGEFEQAIPVIKIAIDLARQAGNEWVVMQSTNIIAEAYYANGQFNKAHKAAEESLALAKKLQARSYEELGWSLLARTNAHQTNYQMAYHYLDSAYWLRDTLFNENNQQHLAFLEMEYQTEKKELKIAALEKQHQLYIWLGIAGAIILLIALAFAYIRYRLAVNKRKLAEEEAQRLEQEKQLVAVQATLDGETAERTRLAKDLHDGLGSMLSLVKFNLPQMKGEAAILETIDVSRFQKAIGMLDDSIQELRRVAHHMMPESLLRYGLKASLTDFCSATPIADFHYFGDETRLSEKMEIMIYRCIHELVNNALKHAQAKHINVQLVQEEDRISFTVQDDGIGFDQEWVTEGMGLQNVRQRVDAFQGKMNIYSSQQGTEIHVEIDFKKEDKND